jgi:LAO/AO transport system kinase
MSKFDVSKLKDGIKKQDRVLLSRAITLIESQNADHRKLAIELLRDIIPKTRPARRIGITGTPGVGKSTFIQSYAASLSKQGKKVAILAIDPSSVKSGGSILGDKTRMGDLTLDDNVYIRPTPSGNYLGGVAQRTRETILLCEAYGFDYVLVETVGVGQSEVSVANMVDCFLMLAQPGAGDELQGIKRGILEVVNVVVINKADGDQLNSAKLAKTQLDNALHILRGQEENIPKSCLCSSINNTGLDEVHKLIEEFFNGYNFNEQRAIIRRLWLDELLENALKQKFFADKSVIKKISEFNKNSKVSIPEFVEDLIGSLKITL